MPDPSLRNASSLAGLLRSVSSDLARTNEASHSELCTVLRSLADEVERIGADLTVAREVLDAIAASCRIDEFGSVFEVHHGDLGDALHRWRSSLA